jgi:hypothetical protein
MGRKPQRYAFGADWRGVGGLIAILPLRVLSPATHLDVWVGAFVFVGENTNNGNNNDIKK